MSPFGKVSIFVLAQVLLRIDQGKALYFLSVKKKKKGRNIREIKLSQSRALSFEFSNFRSVCEMLSC